jgi:hypothetical protein
MKTRTNSPNRTRSSEAALALVLAMEADLREIRDRIRGESDGPEDRISHADNADLNSIRREVRLLLQSVGEGPA